MTPSKAADAGLTLKSPVVVGGGGLISTASAPSASFADQDKLNAIRKGGKAKTGTLGAIAPNEKSILDRTSSYKAR